MTDMRSMALRVAVLKVLADRVKEANTQARAELKEAMDNIGAEKVTATLPDGTKVAAASMAGGGAKARVVNDAKFLAWVRENHPQAIEERVRTTDKDAILDRLAEDGEEAPGVELYEAAMYVYSRFATGGKDAIPKAWQSGALSLPDVLAPPAIEPGGE